MRTQRTGLDRSRIRQGRDFGTDRGTGTTVNIEEIKEELRNKRSEVAAGATASCFVVLVAGAPALAALGIMVTAGACLFLGIKDGSSGHKVTGWAYGIGAGFLFLVGSSVGLAGGECRKTAETEGAVAACAEVDAEATAWMRRTGGLSLLLVLTNPIIGWLGRERLRDPGSFSRQFVDNEPRPAPNRWFEKEKGFETFVLEELAQSGVGKRQIYEWVCEIREVAPETHGDERYEDKAANVLASGEWHCVYALIERCWPLLGMLHRDHFARRVNDYLREAQIGWMMNDGEWERLGDEIGAGTIESAASACAVAGVEDARSDLENAWKLCNSTKGGYEKDAVSAATRALEGMVQERSGQPGVSLTRIKGLNTIVHHEKLRGAIQSLYSYSSDQARHAKKGSVITRKDAYFTVMVAAALVSYLGDWNGEGLESDETTPSENTGDEAGIADGVNAVGVVQGEGRGTD